MEIKISEDFITAAAPNDSAVKNGKALAKNSFSNLGTSEDGTLLIGNCAGSGKKPYSVSADFIDSAAPVFRCTCPSRQFPCKHAVGLLYCYLNGNKFAVIEIPQEITDKRAKITKKEENKQSALEEAIQSPDTFLKAKKINLAALKKKIASQIEGLDIMLKAANSIVKDGLAALDKKTLDEYSKIAKQMGDYYLTGVQDSFREFLGIFSPDSDFSEEERYSLGMSAITKLSVLCKKGKEYLTEKMNSEDCKKDISSDIEARLGYAWQLVELLEEGLYIKDAELIQLSFNCYVNEAAATYEDIGIWFCKNNKKTYKTVNYRPFKAVKYIKVDDSILRAIKAPVMYIYPGKINERVRYDKFQMNENTSENYSEIIASAETAVKNAIKEAKDHLKNILSDRGVYILLKYKEIALLDSGNGENDVVLVDDSGEKLVLSDCESDFPKTLHLLKFVGSHTADYSTVLLRFSEEPDSNILNIAPLCLIGENSLLRLAY